MNNEQTEQLSSVGLYQTHALDGVIYGLGISAVLGAISTLAISAIAGFSLLTTIPLLLIFQVFSILILRRRLGEGWVTGWISTLLFITCILASCGFGMVNVAIAFGVLGGVFVSMKWGLKAGGAALFIFFLFIFIVSYSFTIGVMAPFVDSTGFIFSLEGILTYGSIALVIAMFLFILFTEYQLNMNKVNEVILAQQEELRHLANHDPLTGLATIRLANEHMVLAIEQAKRSNHKVALLFLELHEVESIINRLGNDEGEQMIKIIAERVRSAIRSTDTTCRIGGNEFMILIAKAESRDEVDVVCKRLFNIVATPIKLVDETLDINITVGGALYPDHASDGIELRKRADEIMYEAKQSDEIDLLIAPD